MNIFRKVWYVLEAPEGPVQLSKWKEILTSNGVVHGDTTIQKPRLVKGISFLQKNREQVMSLLSVDNLRYVEMGTDIDNFRLLSTYSVNVESPSNLEQWVDIKPVLNEYARLNNIHIFVSNPHGLHHPVVEDPGALHIFFWSSPLPFEKKAYSIDSAFGIQLSPGQKDSAPPPLVGRVIFDSYYTPVAEVLEDTLYVLFDLPHTTEDASNAAELMKAILDEYSLLKLSDDEKSAMLKTRAAERQKVSRELYVKACQDRYSQYYNDLLKERESVRSRINEYSRQMAEALRREQALEPSIDLMSRVVGESESHFAMEYDNLCKIPKVSEVVTHPSKIVVRTGVLVTYPLSRDNTVRELGEYLITIYYDGSTPTVRNLTRNPNNEPHPYHTSGGNLCYGNILEALSRLIAKFEFSAVAQLVIEFLESSLIDSDLDANDWPVVVKGD